MTFSEWRKKRYLQDSKPKRDPNLYQSKSWAPGWSPILDMMMFISTIADNQAQLAKAHSRLSTHLFWLSLLWILIALVNIFWAWRLTSFYLT